MGHNYIGSDTSAARLKALNHYFGKYKQLRDRFEGDPRIVSYADNMATCTLNYQGEEYFFNLSGTTKNTGGHDE